VGGDVAGYNGKPAYDAAAALRPLEECVTARGLGTVAYILRGGDMMRSPATMAGRRHWSPLRGMAHTPASHRLGSHVMKTYRCYFLDGNSRVRAFRHIVCADDAAAMTRAVSLLKQNRCHAAELWHRAQWVGQWQRGLDPPTPLYSWTDKTVQSPAAPQRATSDNN
jgi:hypothetical protein